MDARVGSNFRDKQQALLIRLRASAHNKHDAARVARRRRSSIPTTERLVPAPVRGKTTDAAEGDQRWHADDVSVNTALTASQVSRPIGRLASGSARTRTAPFRQSNTLTAPRQFAPSGLPASAL